VCRPGDEVRQQQATQPYVPTSQMYDSRPPAAVGRSGESWMMEASHHLPSVTSGSIVPSSEQMQSWDTGRMMPVPVPSAIVKSETVSSATTAYAPYQTSTAEQTSGILSANVVAGQTENWNQYGAAYDPVQGQTASSDMQRYLASTTEYYDNRQNVNETGNLSGLEVSTGGLPSARGVSSSALRQPATTPGSGKKTVTFHENIATEYAIRQSYGSTSSDSSFVALSPPEMSSGYDAGMMYHGPVSSYGSQVPR